ncbi:taste receptor type 2 member 5 [Molossus nigricans]
MQVTVLGLLMVVAMAEFLIGLVGNGVLVVWSFVGWVRKFKGSSYNLIVLGLAGCRFLLQCLIMVDLIVFSIFQSSYWFLRLGDLWVVVSQASLWFATFLSLFYCKKIATFEHPVYLWLKQRAYVLSAGCVLGCLLINLLLVTQMGFNPCSAPPENSSVAHCHYLYILQLNAGSGLPFSVFLISSGALIVSLFRHHKKMKVHTAGRNDAQATAHIRVLKSLVCFLVLYLVYVVASPYSITAKSSPVSLTTVLISETLMAAYPSLHSVILIAGNPRVKQACRSTLRRAVRACRS